MPNGRVLIIAGSDSGGGAGIQADIKTVTMLNGYAMTAITALTAQNTEGVKGIHPVPPAFVKQQIELVLQDIGASTIKTGMLHSAELIEAVAGLLKRYPNIPLIVDPVMVAKGGTSLLKHDATQALQEQLLPLATLITPNIQEAEILSGMLISNEDGMINAGRRILKQTNCKAVLVKGGHLNTGDRVIDILVSERELKRFFSPRLESKHTHGTGCTLASAIATYLAQKLDMEDAIVKARYFVHQAIKMAPGFGHGHGPLNHNWRFEKQSDEKQTA